jgi:predicted O-linked N-acetylglucosamine transferase (SPINDLY family)
VIFARSEIFALRPAPLQINCIGFPGTLGASHYDYIVTDALVTPPSQAPHFAERFLILPHCYMPGDTQREIGVAPTREQYGLADDAFVFCCFNTAYKIVPTMFDVWMGILRAVPNAALWLLDSHAAVAANLKREAFARGVDPARIVFAPRVPLREHLARHSIADLFLDTLPCNAHTTANDALFAGLPLLTCAGDTFASRVSASHLHAIGLPELVTTSLEGYETLAISLAREPAALQGYRQRLEANRATAPLFDTAAYTRALEDLLVEAWHERVRSSA